jgi:Uma2 family endonuclease
MEATAAVPAPAKKANRKIPDALIYEVMDGQPYYRKGYKSVLNQTKKVEDIMGASTLQSVIVFYLQKILFQAYPEDAYWVLTNEAGLHIGKGNNLAGDIFVFENQILPPSKISKRYADVPPLLAIEIDVRIDLEKESGFLYVNRKIRKLLDFGVEKVIWILTETQQVIVAERNAVAGQFLDWNQDVEIRPGLIFNIGKYLEKRGIVVE